MRAGKGATVRVGALGLLAACVGMMLGEVAPVQAAEPAATPAGRPAGGAVMPELEIRARVLLVVLDDPRPGAEDFPAALVEEIAAELQRVYQVEVRRVAARPLPRSAFYAPRRRYKADRLLEHLAALVSAEALPAGTRVLGLTTADISTRKPPHKDWGVFGLGSLGGTAAVVSSHRLRKQARDWAQVRWRVTNTAVHELGHVLGLDHCTESNCVMLDAQGGITNTDESSGVPGPQCRALLDRSAPLRPAGAFGAAR